MALSCAKSRKPNIPTEFSSVSSATSSTKPPRQKASPVRFCSSFSKAVSTTSSIAPTRAAARQLVLHRHITVNGQVVNIASYQVKPGDIVGVRERSKSLEVIADALAGFNHSKYPWIEWDEATKSGKLLHVPAREDIPENIKEQLIVELYSK